MNSGIELFNKLYMGDRQIKQILIDLDNRQVVMQVDDVDILPDEKMDWRPGLDLPSITNAQLVFDNFDVLTISPQDSAIERLIFLWEVVPIEQSERSGSPANYRFEFLIMGDPTPVTLRIEADDFYIKGIDETDYR